MNPTNAVESINPELHGAMDPTTTNEQHTETVRQPILQRQLPRRDFLKLLGATATIATAAYYNPRGGQAAAPGTENAPTSEGDIESRQFTVEQSFKLPVTNSVNNFFHTYIDHAGLEQPSSEYNIETSTGGVASRIRYLSNFTNKLVIDPKLVNPDFIPVVFGEQQEYQSEIMDQLNQSAPKVTTEGVTEAESANSDKWKNLAAGLVELLGKDCDPVRVSRVKISGSAAQNTANVGAAEATSTDASITQGEISIRANSDFSLDNKMTLLHKIVNEMAPQNKQIKVDAQGNTICVGLSLQQWGSHLSEGLNIFTSEIDWLKNTKFPTDPSWSNIANKYGSYNPDEVEEFYTGASRQMMLEILTGNEEDLQEYDKHPQLKSHLLKGLKYLTDSHTSDGAEIEPDKLNALRTNIKVLLGDTAVEAPYKTFIPNVQG